jgi:hypothetical protein
MHFGISANTNNMIPVSANVNVPGMQVNTNVGYNGPSVSAGIGVPGVHANIGTTGISAGIGVPGVHANMGINGPIYGVNIPGVVIVGANKLPLMQYRRNAITVIVLACFAPWGCLTYVGRAKTQALAMVIISLLMLAGLIVASCFALHMPSSKSGWNGRRFFVLIMCSIGSAFYAATIAIWIQVIILIKSLSPGESILEDIILIVCIVLLGVDLAFKVPLIVNAMLLGTRVFKHYKP